MSKALLYVGLLPDSYKNGGWIFKTAEPNKSKNPSFLALIGPFRTKRAAMWMAHPVRGLQNPHCRSVADAERLSKKYDLNGNLKV